MRRAAGLLVLLAGLAAASLLATAPASAHAPRAGRPGDAGVPGMSEKQLRQFETQVLGPEHAAEHARLRHEIRLREAGKAASGASTSPGTGTRAIANPPPAPNVGGRWQQAFQIPVIGINAIVLPTGKVMWFAYPRNPNEK